MYQPKSGEASQLPVDVAGDVPGDTPAVVPGGGLGVAVIGGDMAGLGAAVAGGDMAGLGMGVVSVGVQPTRSTAAKMTDRVSAMSFFMMILLLTNIIAHGCKTAGECMPFLKIIFDNYCVNYSCEIKAAAVFLQLLNITHYLLLVSYLSGLIVFGGLSGGSADAVPCSSCVC